MGLFGLVNLDQSKLIQGMDGTEILSRPGIINSYRKTFKETIEEGNAVKDRASLGKLYPYGIEILIQC